MRTVGNLLGVIWAGSRNCLNPLNIGFGAKVGGSVSALTTELHVTCIELYQFQNFALHLQFLCE